MKAKELEKYSSAFTLSDMEIFIFPELLYSLVLANIMSPRIWKWRDDPWFKGVDKMSPLKKVHRLKQYIMDHYNFNLDLDTWGLTDKQTEISRFSEFLDPETLKQSNALFGYEGDRYYFDLDIRKHFGLDKYDSDIIPYWKTETVEAMDAFRYKPGYPAGAGECVSLASLYAAALFVVAAVPLEKICLMGTPLHSQNFVLVDEGVLTNNRRIVTKAMWYNGTELSSLARRALEHERVTIVANNTGYIHFLYPEATISETSFRLFREKLTGFLETKVTFEVFINFLRANPRYQKEFQLSFQCTGRKKFIRLEKAFGYEHDSKHRLGDKTGRKLFCEMDEEDLSCCEEFGRVLIGEEDFIFRQPTNAEFFDLLLQEHPGLAANRAFMHDLRKFVHTVPQLPSGNKHFVTGVPLSFRPDQTREEIVQYLSSRRADSVVADLAFYTGRYMESCDWQPFLKAVFERNPVATGHLGDRSLEEAYHELKEWPAESIYEGNRLALPDEVVNFGRGDGIEKALTLATFARKKHGLNGEIRIGNGEVHLVAGKQKFQFPTSKSLPPHTFSF